MKQAFKFWQISWVFAVTLVLPVRAAVIVNPWVPIFKGIEFATGKADEAEPRLQEVQALRIDLNDPDIQFFSTPADLSGETNALETISQRTSEFLTAYSLQVAINANFFSPCCSGTAEPKELLGLAMSEGEVVSPATTSGTGTEVLVITEDNVASISLTTGSFNPEDYWTAVAGSDIVLANGVKRTNFSDADFYTNGHPRTAVGISQDRRYLIFMTIDGRQPGYSLGAPMPSVAEWLVRFGAYNGLNLDGGGSTTMVREQDGAAVRLNQAGGERMVGNSLGVWALPLPLTIISAPPPDQTVFLSQNVNLSLVAEGPKPITYQWQYNGADIPNATNTSYSITNIQFSHAGDYSVIVSSPGGTETIIAHLTVTDEIIVTSAEVELTGSWTPSTASTSKFSNYFFYTATTPGAGTAEALFRPTIPIAGDFDVYIWYSAGANRTTNAPLLLFSNEGSKFASINQTTNGGAWQRLFRRENFAVGSAGFVSLANDTGELNRLLIADAVRFHYRPEPVAAKLVSARVSTNGQFQVSIMGEPDLNYAVEASLNLTNWVTLTNFTMPIGTFQFTDTAPNLSRRFYRTRVVP